MTTGAGAYLNQRMYQRHPAASAIDHAIEPAAKTVSTMAAFPAAPGSSRARVKTAAVSQVRRLTYALCSSYCSPCIASSSSQPLTSGHISCSIFDTRNLLPPHGACACAAPRISNPVRTAEPC